MLTEDAREFACRVVNQLLIRPGKDIDDTRALPDLVLSNLCRAIVEASFIKDQSPAEGESWAQFAALKDAFEAQNERIAQLNQQIASSLARFHEAMTLWDDTIREVLRSIEANARFVASAGRLFSQIPRRDYWLDFELALEPAAAKIKETGYGFFLDHMPVTDVFELGNLPARERRIAISRRLLTASQNRTFVDETLRKLAGSRLLRKRTKVVREGLENHQERRYYSAISTLLPQVEGILGDLVGLSGRVRLSRNKLYELDGDGRNKRGKDGKRIEVKGGARLAQLAVYEDGHPLELTVDVLANEIFRDRNPILHGRKANFGKPKESARVALILYVLANELAGIESKAGGEAKDHER